MWIKLRELYAPKGRAAWHMLLKKVVQASLDGSTSIEVYINSIKKCFRGLANMGTTVPKWMLVSFLIFGLNKSYNTLVTVLENLCMEDDLTFENAITALMEESHCKKLYKDPVALLSRVPKSANT
jgi:gag-polypeptide of LTR copia-type